MLLGSGNYLCLPHLSVTVLVTRCHALQWIAYLLGSFRDLRKKLLCNVFCYQWHLWGFYWTLAGNNILEHFTILTSVTGSQKALIKNFFRRSRNDPKGFFAETDFFEDRITQSHSRWCPSSRPWVILGDCIPEKMAKLNEILSFLKDRWAENWSRSLNSLLPLQDCR